MDKHIIETYGPRPGLRDRYMDAECALCRLVVRIVDNTYNANGFRCRRCGCARIRLWR